MNWKTSLLATAALGGVLLFGGAAAQARDRDDKCFERMRREEIKLDRDIQRHGFNSRQARHDREKLREARERCRFERGRFDRDGDFRRHRDRDRNRDDRWRRDRDDRNRRRHDGDHDRDDRWRRDRDRDDH